MVAHYFRIGKMEKVTEIFSHHLVDILLRKMKYCSKSKKQDGVFPSFFLSHPALRRLVTAPIVYVCVQCPVCVVSYGEYTKASIFRGGEGGWASRFSSWISIDILDKSNPIYGHVLSGPCVAFKTNLL